ncbi:MAG: alpha-ribazole phosphatase family protein [Deltaproteobacteria bacterium]|nr:alpha-ribazole phosphatase family protein [Deltaproteobacteria bacterium]
MRLILIRHTRPAVADNVCYGVTDVDVAPTFEEDTARVLATLPAVERLVTSPLRRCARLAERIGAARGLVPVVDNRIREMDFGRWERLPWSAIDRTELDAWAADFLHARPHGGESVAMVSERVSSALADYRRSGVSHAVVTHAGIIKAARAAAGCADAWMTSAGFGDAVHIEFPAEPERSPSGPREVESWD